MQYEIRSLSIGGILDQTVTLVKNHFVLLLGIAAVLYVPMGLINGAIATAMLPTPPTMHSPPEVMVAYQEAVLQSMIYLGPLSALFLLIMVPLTNAAMIHGVAKCYLSEPVTVGSAWSNALRIVIPVMLTQVLYYLAVFGGMILCIIPGIIFAFWFGLCIHAVVIEGLSGVAAMKRSKFLMKGNIGQMMVLGLLVGVIGAVINGISSLISQQQVACGRQICR